MKEKRQGITSGTGSAVALIACIVYTIMTILFIVRHSLSLKLFLLSVAVMIAMTIIVVSMWIGFFVSRTGKISNTSTLLAKIGLLIKMVAGIALVVANFVAFFVFRNILMGELPKGVSFKESWNELSNSNLGGVKFFIPSYTQLLIILVIIGVTLLVGLAMYVFMSTSSCSYVNNVKKNSKYGGEVKGRGVKVSLTGFALCYVVMLVFKIIQYVNFHGLYTQALVSTDVTDVSYNDMLKELETGINRALEELDWPIKSINLRYGLGLSTSAFVMDIIYVVLVIAFTVLVFILLGKISKSSVMPVTVQEHFDSDEDFLDESGEAGTTKLVADELNYKKEEYEFRSRKGSIKCISGTDVGFVYSISEGEELIIGKDPRSAHIVVGSEYKQVSRRHCGIRYDAVTDSYNVIDYSSNGTYVNGNRKLTNGIYLNVAKGNDIYLATDKNVYRLG